MGMGVFHPTAPEGHKHRVTTPEKPRKIPRTIGETPEGPRIEKIQSRDIEKIKLSIRNEIFNRE